ncbi:hypothetical protein BDF14DRAFT_1842032 [Spinellus fusiger]|nr:hypothetical protein BDF14DRAFT_1842032 [Spinellus fusiger]
MSFQKTSLLQHLTSPISIPPPRYQPINEGSLADTLQDACSPPPAYQTTLQHTSSLHAFPSHGRHSQRLSPGAYYQPIPPPQAVIIHHKPIRSHDACCWGCLAALCLCFGIKECC